MFDERNQIHNLRLCLWELLGWFHLIAVPVPIRFVIIYGSGSATAKSYGSYSSGSATLGYRRYQVSTYGTSVPYIPTQIAECVASLWAANEDQTFFARPAMLSLLYSEISNPIRMSRIEYPIFKKVRIRNPGSGSEFRSGCEWRIPALLCKIIFGFSVIYSHAKLLPGTFQAFTSENINKMSKRTILNYLSAIYSLNLE
jgi:hypothetical protein